MTITVLVRLATHEKNFVT